MTELFTPSVFVSAVSPGGLEPLRASLAAQVRSLRPVVEVRIPASDGRLLATLHREGEVVDQRTDGDELVVRARVSPALAGRLQARNGH